MIIFYDKKTGNIVGTIEGRIHSDDQLKMWIGNTEDTERILVDWKPTGKENVTEKVTEEVIPVGVDQYGGELYRRVFKKKKIKSKQYEPNHPQKSIFKKLDSDPRSIREYKVDVKTRKLVPNNT